MISLLILIAVDSLTNTTLTLAFIPEFIAGMLGILLGLGLGISVEGRADARKGLELYEDLKFELAMCLGLLEKSMGDYVHRLPTANWNSGIMSGTFSLIRDTELRRHLYSHFVSVEGINWQLNILSQKLNYADDNLKKSIMVHLEERMRLVHNNILTFLRSVDTEEKYVLKSKKLL